MKRTITIAIMDDGRVNVYTSKDTQPSAAHMMWTDAVVHLGHGRAILEKCDSITEAITLVNDLCLPISPSDNVTQN